MNEKFKQIPGLSREAEEQKLAEVIKIAQSNLEKAQDDISRMDQDVADLYDSIEQQDKEILILWNDATIRLRQFKR